jgi:fatty-acyl-CoA synthase
MHLSYASGPSSTPLIGRTIGAEFDRVAEATPDALAVVSRHQGARLSYAQLHDAVERAARAFLALDVEKGDRVGIWAGNCLEWLIVKSATAKVGAILVNVNPAWSGSRSRERSSDRWGRLGA